MKSFQYRICHDEDNPLCGSLSIDPERHEELKGYEYTAMEESLRRYYLGGFGIPPYSGGEVKVSRVDVSLKDGVKVTLETDISEDGVHRSLLQFIECLKEVKGRNPSLCLVIKKPDEKC